MKLSKRPEDIKFLLPFYVKNKSLFNNCEEIQKLLKQEEFKEDLKFWELVNQEYNEIKQRVPNLERDFFPEIIERINLRKKKSRFIYSIFNLKTRFSFALVVVQFLFIVALVFYIMNLKHEYKTLSANQIGEKTVAVINVVFDENAKEKEIRELLKTIDGRIIDGPSITGLYVVSIKDEKKMDFALQTLKSSNIVFFVEVAN